MNDTGTLDTRPVDTRPVNTRPVDTRPMDSRSVLDGLTAALNAHVSEAIRRGCSEDVVVTSPDGTFAGAADATAYFDCLLAAFPDLHLHVWSKVTSGELVVDEWTLTGTHTGPFLLRDGSTLPATGRLVTIRGCDVAAVEDGRVISLRMYFDQTDFLHQLGVA